MTTGSESEPLILIVSGPSGSGKSTLVQKILELPGTMPSISCTYSAQRSRDLEVQWESAMLYVTEEEFDAMVSRGTNFCNTRAGIRQACVWHAEKVARGIAQQKSGSCARDRCAGCGAGKAKTSGVGGDFYFAAVARGVGAPPAWPRPGLRTVEIARRLAPSSGEQRSRRSENITITVL